MTKLNSLNLKLFPIKQTPQEQYKKLLYIDTNEEVEQETTYFGVHDKFSFTKDVEMLGHRQKKFGASGEDNVEQ